MFYGPTQPDLDRDSFGIPGDKPRLGSGGFLFLGWG